MSHASKGRVPLIIAASVLSLLVRLGDARACEPIDMCVWWTQVPLQDAGYGDLVTDSTYPARGARITVIRPYPEPAFSTFLDESGCTTFDSQFSAGHKLLVYTEAVLGVGTAGTMRIKTFESEAAQVEDADSVFAIDIPSIPATPDRWAVHADVPADAEHRVMLLATATETLHRLHGLEGSLIAGSHALEIVVRHDLQNASAPQGRILVGAAGFDEGVSSLQRKFILGHEIGHWIQTEIVGDVWDYNYNYGPCGPGDGETCTGEPPFDPWVEVQGNAVDEPCQHAVEFLLPDQDDDANPNRHGIRSAEFVSGAMPEGFGHFVASVAFNSDLGVNADGAFKYYKDIDEDTLPSYEYFEDPLVDDRVVSLLGGTGSPPGGPNRWVELQCSNDWDHPLEAETLDQEVSSEVDWLRFFWRFTLLTARRFADLLGRGSARYLYTRRPGVRVGQRHARPVAHDARRYRRS